MDIKSSFAVRATLVPDEFIDRYMASANGEYIKEYLFLLRHEREEVTVSMMADALDHTEADVARALAYWKKQGVLIEEVCDETAKASAGDAVRTCKNGPDSGLKDGQQDKPCKAGESDRMELRRTDSDGGAGRSGMVRDSAADQEMEDKSAGGRSGGMTEEAPGAGMVSGTVSAPRPAYPPDKVSALAGDEEFAQLLYIAQKYMNKVFTQRECEVFAYLYDGIHMDAELLEYMVEYCVQGGHMSIRYMETVALNWHERGIKDVDEAKRCVSSFSRDSFAVLKAFGINDRKPGSTEQDMISKWYGTYGFTKELVLEACNRTMDAIHAPSFKYADKILSDWKKAGVHTREDVKKLDEQHAGRKRTEGTGQTGGSGDARGTSGGAGKKNTANQFQNFPQRDIDYDALVLQQLTGR